MAATWHSQGSLSPVSWLRWLPFDLWGGAMHSQSLHHRNVCRIWLAPPFNLAQCSFSLACCAGHTLFRNGMRKLRLLIWKTRGGATGRWECGFPGAQPGRGAAQWPDLSTWLPVLRMLEGRAGPNSLQVELVFWERLKHMWHLLPSRRKTLLERFK